MVATGAVPYSVISLDPFEVDIDLEEMAKGQTFAALCRPPFERLGGRSESFCQSCFAEADCLGDSLCYNSLTGQTHDNPEALGATFCVELCSETAECPLGFTCETIGDGTDGPSACLPITDTCTDCIDRDQDGQGVGNCGPDGARQTPYDCDDFNPQAFFDLDDLGHPFPDFCYDDIANVDTYFFDLNCNGILDNKEQIGSSEWGQYHCTSCGDVCSGTTNGGFRVCMNDESTGQPFCGVGCQPGYATCSGDPADGCPININDEQSLGGDKLYRDSESPYIWYDAPEGALWATSSAVANFFCSEEEALQALDNPTQQRGCHPSEPGAHPGAVQICDLIDWNCSGLAGPQDPETTDDIGNGVVHVVGEDCAVPGAEGLCAPGVAQCANSGGAPEMLCQPLNPQYPVAIPYFTAQDTTCDGFSDYFSDTEDYRFSSQDALLTLISTDGAETVVGTDQVVTLGAPCKVPGLLGECAIGAVSCTPEGLICEQVTFPQPEQPGFDGIDHSCDGWDRHFSSNGDPHVIYVDLADAGPTLPEAIKAAAQCDGLTIGGVQIPCDVFVQASTSFNVNETIELIEGVHVYGGFDPIRWDPRESNFNVPNYNTIGSPATRIRVDTHVGLLGDGILETTHFYGVEVVTADMNDQVSCTPNIGAICRECDGLKLRKVSITSGAAARGANAPQTTPYPEATQPAAPGETGDYNNNSNLRYPNGGGNEEDWAILSRPTTLLAGGHGGRNDWSSQGNNFNRTGLTGWHPERGGGLAFSDDFSNSGVAAAQGQDGLDGAPYEPPFLGIPESFHFALSASNLEPPVLTTECLTYELPDKLAHFDISAGGGGGGSALMPHNISMFGIPSNLRVASGGQGGAPGANGAPGTPGAASIAFVLINTQATGTADSQFLEFHNVTFTSGAGGNGGAGADGTNGQASAEAARTSYITTNGNRRDLYGGRGGSGAGGSGGHGGHGGPSISLLRINSPIGANQPNLTGATGGIGGIGGSPGQGGDTAPNGFAGEMGESSTCRHYRVDSTSFTFTQADCLD